MTFHLAGKRVWVAGHNGMVGSALMRRLNRENCNLITVDRTDVDLRRQTEVESWMQAAHPEVVFLAAARVGGIHANSTFPADFLYDNVAIQTNVIGAARAIGVQKLVFLGSSCIYPRDVAQPIAEAALLTGALESTNEWYALAKIVGVKMCVAFRRQHGSDFISAMPANLYGPGDNFHPEYSHAPAALLRRFHEAKVAGAPEVVVWGTGKPLREFLHVDDLADAAVFLLVNYSDDEHVNVGTGEDITIAHFAESIRDVVGYSGRIVFDPSRPDGVPRKVVDVTKITQLGWRASIPLQKGLQHYYDWFLENLSSLRGWRGDTQKGQ